MKFIDNVLSLDPDFATLLSDIKKDRLPVVCTGLSLVHKAAVIAAVARECKKKITVVTKDEAEALAFADDARQLGLNAVNFPQRDLAIGEFSGYSREYEQKRTDTLSILLDGDFDLLTVSVDAALQYTTPPDVLAHARFTLSQGDTVDLKELTDRLLSAGYTRSEICEGKGQFSVRGGIFDIFPVNASAPLRIEFWGDEIDGISYYDTETQRRTDMVDSVEITPACEVLENPLNVIEKLKEYLKSKEKFTDKQREKIEADISALENGISVQTDRYIPLIYPLGETIFDYVTDNIIFVSESGNITERLKSIFLQQSADVESYLEEGFLSPKTAKLSLDKSEFWDTLSSAIILENFPRGSYEVAPKDIVNFNYKRSTPWNGDVGVLLEDISYIAEQKGSIVVLAGEKRAAEVLTRELSEKGINAMFLPQITESVQGVTITLGGLSGGFEIPSQKFLLVSHKYIAYEGKRTKRKAKKGQEIGSLDELKVGDYVVHEAHGIGIFDGINRITNQGVTKDYIKIKYAKSDVLYVPVTQLDLVSRYIGAATEDGGIKLNRLGTSEWQKTRKRVRAAVRDMAKQLTALYAKRMSIKGYAFSPDTDLQNDFERRFEYEETDDQLRCIHEIKSDMERSVPMDRLLCGDVGFGKTEVALRAAFKCISEGKQCALLVPTTILAMQHYNTILRRFGDMPITVKLLNRFVTPKQQERIISDLKRHIFGNKTMSTDNHIESTASKVAYNSFLLLWSNKSV